MEPTAFDVDGWSSSGPSWMEIERCSPVSGALLRWVSRCCWSTVDRQGLRTWRRQVRAAELWITSGAATTSACTRSGFAQGRWSPRWGILFEGKPTRTAGAKRRGAEAARQPVSAGDVQSA